MANSTSKKKQSWAVLKQITLIMGCVGCGYVLAVLYDFQQISEWFMLSQKSFIASKEVTLPQPKLEFYTLLPQSTPSVPAAAASTKPAIVAVTPSVNHQHQDEFVLQLASFQRRQDAERLKAALIMNGFDVQIHPVSQQNMTWYRIMLGPFSSRTDAQQMQNLIARRQRLVGIIRKLDV